MQKKKRVSFNLQFICKRKSTWNYSSPTFILHFLEVFCIQILSHTLFCHASKSMHFRNLPKSFHLIIKRRPSQDLIWGLYAMVKRKHIQHCKMYNETFRVIFQHRVAYFLRHDKIRCAKVFVCKILLRSVRWMLGCCNFMYFPLCR